MNLRRGFFCFIFILLYLVSSGVHIAGKNPSVKIRVIMDDNYPPYSYRDNRGKLQGIVVDQWKRWEKRTGIQAELKAMDWNLVLKTVQKGNFDIIDTAFENSERKKYLSFGKPYADIKVAIFFHKNISGITGIESLKGFRVGVKKGDNCINLLRQRGITNYVEFPNYESIVKAAKEHRIMVYVMDKPPALFYLYKMGIQNDFKSSASLYSGQLHRGVKIGNQKLLDIVQSGFDSISEREYQDIDDKWKGTSYDNSRPIFVFGIGILTASLIALVLLIWSFTLRKMVRHKTKELVAMVEAVGKREKNLEALLYAIPDMVFVMDKNGVYLECYTKEDSYLLAPCDTIIGRTVSELLPESSSRNVMNAIQKVLECKEVQIIEYSFENNGEIHYYESRMVLYEEEKVLQIVRDMTDKKLAVIEIYEMSVHDGLTGLYNRNYFEMKLNETNWGQDTNIAMVLCDLDGLKIINDTLGHDVGDQCLKAVAAELSKNFRETDLVTRIGGDEFAVIMKNTTLKEIGAIRQKLKESLTTAKVRDVELPISVSLGYSISDNPEKDKRLIFKEADDYMYREKLHQQHSVKSKIVTVLLRMLEARDFVTEGHCERLQGMTAKLAARIGLNEQEINDIILFAQFHDIGKVGISDAILFKPGKLTPLEYEEMKRHSEIGYRIASSIPDLVPIADWIYKHHEWWNGSGYPLGLGGHEIPAQCRILSIVDAFDAMISDRPYRKALPVEEAIKEILRCSGSQFDPEYVDHFIEVIKDDLLGQMEQEVQ
jgi:diguanylate cyclase (GGDEF)-like protein/PAS domain S-box-containing protein